MSEPKTQNQRRRLTGTVVSTKMDKTALVRVDRTETHPKYGKRFTTSKKYKVHDEQNQLVEGDKIIFEECRPLSKDKKWRLISKVK
jgi:small subunit ribosomal protein S17